MGEKDNSIENHMRFQDLDWYNKDNFQEIIVGGAGGIGSWVALYVTRIGHRIHLYDDDVIDVSNMGGQLYQQSQIGINKASATATNCGLFNGTTSIMPMGRYTEDSYVSPIMISCFDNMEARKTMFDNWKAQEDRELFLDGRMLSEIGMIFCVTKGQEEAYEATLFADSEVEEAPCSAKATSHCGSLTAVLLTNALNAYIGNKAVGVTIRDLPFQYNFELPMFLFKEQLS